MTKNINGIQIIGDNAYFKGMKVAELSTTASTTMDEFKELIGERAERGTFQNGYDSGYEDGERYGYNQGKADYESE